MKDTNVKLDRVNKTGSPIALKMSGTTKARIWGVVVGCLMTYITVGLIWTFAFPAQNLNADTDSSGIRANLCSGTWLEPGSTEDCGPATVRYYFWPQRLHFGEGSYRVSPLYVPLDLIAAAGVWIGMVLAVPQVRTRLNAGLRLRR